MVIVFFIIMPYSVCIECCALTAGTCKICTLIVPGRRAYFTVQLITICAAVKWKCAVEKGNVCSKKCRDSDQTVELCTDFQVLCSCKSCLKYALPGRKNLILSLHLCLTDPFNGSSNSTTHYGNEYWLSIFPLSYAAAQLVRNTRAAVSKFFQKDF